VIASHPSRTPSLLASLALGLAAAGCATRAATPVAPLVESEPLFSAQVPDVADHTAAELAAAALAGDPTETALALRRLKAIDTVLVASDEPATGLQPVSIDLVNATLVGGRAYRSATLELLERRDLDPATYERLSQAALDDPLVAADARIRDARMIEFGRAFNTLAEPVGKSILTLTLMPYRLAQSVVEYAMSLWQEDALPLQRRQALVDWKEFIARYPDAPEVPELQPKVEAAEAQFKQTQRNQALRVADRALAQGDVRTALVFSDRALRIMPEDPGSLDRRDEAAAGLLALRADQARSLEAAPAAPGSADARPLAVALLLPSGPIEATAGALLAAEPHGPLADEARFSLAIAHGEAGQEDRMWDEFESLGAQSPARSNMARHAAALAHDAKHNAWAAFKEARWRDLRNRAVWVLVGTFYAGPQDLNLPKPLEWIFEAPSIAQSMMSSPLRLLQVPWLGALPSTVAVAVAAQDYLARHPTGAHADVVRKWLIDYEGERKNWIGALAIAQTESGADLAELDRLRNLAAAQALDASTHEKNRGMRVAMLRMIVERFEATPSETVARQRLKDEIETATAQRIRISRGFLLENPRVAGPHGLALAPGLLDGDLSNGELHPEGVVLIGGRELEICMIAEGADASAPPHRMRQAISPEHLARFVSEVEEADLHNSLVDSDDDFAPNAQRDVFFERARLGLADDVDARPTASSQYAYTGMRERYGVVRGRDSILPFELVFSGSLADFSLGAMPRMIPPKETPDAILYK
jgi:hypothetical protein